MRFGRSAFFLTAALLASLPAASSYQKDKPAEEPRYDTSAPVDWIGVVTAVKDVAAGNVLNGTHILVRPESARANSEPIDVYLAPDDYLKDFGCHFAKGDKVQVKGSKVKYEHSTAVLAREVRMESTTVYLRDDQGVPYWKNP
jgi:hypothetical protein